MQHAFVPATLTLSLAACLAPSEPPELVFRFPWEGAGTPDTRMARRPVAPSTLAHPGA